MKYPNSDPMKKLCALLDDMYKDGDLDTRSIVTIGLLNNSGRQRVPGFPRACG